MNGFGIFRFSNTLDVRQHFVQALSRHFRGEVAKPWWHGHTFGFTCVTCVTHYHSFLSPIDTKIIYRTAGQDHYLVRPVALAFTPAVHAGC
jgi:hypothetical protein